jgi:hypothetical protein
MKLGLSNNLVKSGMIKLFPEEDLAFAWFGQYDDTSLVNTLGSNIPYVSGSGLDAIYDFTILSDIRFDKSNATYWGESVDAYFYYDEENPYHAKLKDFHYKYLNAQVTFDNTFFLKAKATTDTSNTIDSIQALLIYSTTQEDANLSRLKTYIGIQEDVLGDEIVDEWEFNATGSWNLGTGYTITGGQLVAAGTGDQCTQLNSMTLDRNYLTEMKLSDVTQGVIRPELGNTNGTNRDSDGVYQEELVATGVQRVALDAGLTFIGKVDYFSVKEYYVDFYSA